MKSAAKAVSRPPLVHMYMQDWLPSENGTGPNNRILSNLRAYVDLGFVVEVVCFRSRKDFLFAPLDGLPTVTWTCIDTETSDGVFDRLGYLSGLSEERALNYRFKTRRAIRRAVEERMRANPKALHHFEYLSTACAFVNLAGCNAIWSMHDLESKFSEAHQKIRTDLPDGKRYGWEKRASKYLEIAERKAARQSRLTLCIARHETEFLRTDWGCAQAEFFPMSIPNESLPAGFGQRSGDRKLRVLHLGRIDSLPSYRSLEFLFEKVFPALGGEIGDRIELIVAGECPDTPKAKRILELARPFSFCKFIGFQDDLRALYAQADIQIVGSTAATGLRTRIVESFAYGVPVLSSTVGAEGALGIVNGENIVLADSPSDFGRELSRLVGGRELRAKIAAGGRRLYDETYSRTAVSGRLGELLKKHLNDVTE